MEQKKKKERNIYLKKYRQEQDAPISTKQAMQSKQQTIALKAVAKARPW